MQYPDGGFSKGGASTARSVPLEKAKLWCTPAHVVQHLARVRYPAGCRVAEIKIATTTTPLFDVDEHLAMVDARRIDQQRREHARLAEERVRAAEAALARVQAALKACER